MGRETACSPERWVETGSGGRTVDARAFEQQQLEMAGARASSMTPAARRYDTLAASAGVPAPTRTAALKPGWRSGAPARLRRRRAHPGRGFRERRGALDCFGCDLMATNRANR